MLEGWYFGERESSFATLGLVPSVAEDGKYVRAGQGQINAVGATIKKIKKRKDAKKSGKPLDEQVRGTMIEKSQYIEKESQEESKRLKVARDGNRHEHLLNETEQTLRYVALHYIHTPTSINTHVNTYIYTYIHIYIHIHIYTNYT
jgi:hypothetical protein